ncbi:hypothetical protein XELAEV_18006809mg [Xenopus laevis]|uniref:Uncharacterized protein n=1 Tax=Xenopus laevis TaxID=8355 RepID=A0A974I4R5_XENLA|nr:hypothetical protein XELAEV_18006809mg [Xenopus laevis]
MLSRFASAASARELSPDELLRWINSEKGRGAILEAFNQHQRQEVNVDACPSEESEDPAETTLPQPTLNPPTSAASASLRVTTRGKKRKPPPKSRRNVGAQAKRQATPTTVPARTTETSPALPSSAHSSHWPDPPHPPPTVQLQAPANHSALNSPWAISMPAQGEGSSTAPQEPCTSRAVTLSAAARAAPAHSTPPAPTCAPQLHLPANSAPQPTSTTRYLHAPGTSSNEKGNQLPTSSMGIDLENLKTTISSSIAKKSWSSYINSWSLWSRHVIVNNNNSDLDNLIHLINQMQAHGKSPNTMKKHIAGISFFLKLFDRPDITKKPIVKQLLKGYQKEKPTADKRKPITLAILLHLVRNLRQMCTSEYEYVMFKLLYIVSFFGALRVGETVSSSKSMPGGLNINDVGLKNNRLQMVIRQSKTDTEGKGAIWHDLLAMLSQMISRWGQPDIVLIHLGVLFVWSQIVSRIIWFQSPETKALDRCRKKINSAIAKFAKGLNFFTYRHTDLELTGSGLYWDDGVHLSDIGLDIFNNGLRNAIELAISKWKGAKAGR